MARCPDCNKFVGYEQAEPELDLSVELDKAEDGTPEGADVTGSVRMVLNCAECGSELAEASLDINDCNVALEHKEAESHDVEVVDESADANDRYDGKPGTPSRYRRHYYGADISGTVQCSCGAKAEFTTTVEEQASGFEQLN